MDMRATQSPIESTHNTSVVGTPPRLGTPTPGTTGGLPAVSGLSVLKNPMAQQLQSMGRGQDSMLVHMTPEEVNSLQGLAMAHGGSLTINPHTGLPEAGWLGKLLPTILGAVGMAFGIPPIWMGVGGAAVGTAITGDLGKGLSMGLQAYGGASLGGAAGIGGKLGHVGQGLGLSGSSAMAMHPTGDALLSSFDKTFSPGVTGGFSNAAKAGLGTGILSKAAVPLAISGALGGLSEANAPNLPKYTPEKQTPYVPMGPGKREVRYQTPEQMRQSGGAEFLYFTPSNPAPVPLSQSQQDNSPTTETDRNYDYGYADGGLAALPAPQGFNDLVNYFGATNPGAITASMYPTSAAPAQPTTQAPPTAGAEQIYNFSNRTPITAGTGTGTTAGIGTGMNFDFSDLANIDWTNVAEQFGYSPTTPAKSTTPTTPVTPTTPTTPIYGDWRDSWMPRNDTAAVTPTAPNYDFGNSGNSFYAPEDSGFGGYDFSQFAPQPEPTQPTQPSYDFTQPTQQGGMYDSTFTNDQPSYDFGNYDFSQFAPQPAAPSYDYSQFAPEPSYNYEPYTPDFSSFESSRVPEAAAPSYDFSQFAPQPEQAQPSYDFSQFAPQPEAAQQYMPPSYEQYLPQPYTPPSYADFMQAYVPEPAPSYDYSQFAPQPDYSGFDYSQFAPQYESGPAIYDMNADQYQTVGEFAEGGTVNMGNGSFVVDARTVSELGNGSSNAGKEILARMGGRPLDGPGDGVSDSIPARIGGHQEARVARDEVIMPPQAVRRIGGGSEKRGTQKLYALMDKAHKARKNAKRGQDTKIAKGLGALA